MKTLANDKRLHILCAIWRKEMSVGDLEEIVGLSQSALSQHLARLRREGTVKTRRDAQTIYYSIECEKAKKMMEAIYNIYCMDYIETQKNSSTT